MEDRKSKKNVIILILVILLIGLGGYLVYDKIINNNDTKTKENIVEKEDDSKEKEQDNNSSNEEKTIEKTTYSSVICRTSNLFDAPIAGETGSQTIEYIANFVNDKFTSYESVMIIKLPSQASFEKWDNSLKNSIAKDVMNKVSGIDISISKDDKYQIFEIVKIDISKYNGYKYNDDNDLSVFLLDPAITANSSKDQLLKVFQRNSPMKCEIN